MTGHYEAPEVGNQWVDADIKMVLVNGTRRLALMVHGEIIALMDPAKVQAQLRYYGG